jgi:hypothetical protein
MANTFLRKFSGNVGNTATVVGSYTVGSNVGAIAIGISVTNTTVNAVTASVSIYNGIQDVYLVKNAPILPNSTLIPVGGEQKIVMQPNDQLRVQSSTASSLDVHMNIMETDNFGLTNDNPPAPGTFNGVFSTTPIGTLPATASELQGYMGGVYISYSTNANVYFTTTTLGSSWTQRSFPTSTSTEGGGRARGVFANSKFYVPLYNNSLGQYQLYSTVDFINWSLVVSDFNGGGGNYRLFATNGTKTYAGKWFNETSPSNAWVTSDGITWTLLSGNFPGKRPNNPKSVAWGAGNDLVAAGWRAGNTVVSGMYYSSNAGNTWTKTSSIVGSEYVAYGNGTYVALSSNSFDAPANVVLTSTDGINWSSAAVDVFSQNDGGLFDSLGYGSGVFLVGDPEPANTRAYISTNGITWTPCTSMPENTLRAINLNNKWVLYSQSNGGNVYSY